MKRITLVLVSIVLISNTLFSRSFKKIIGCQFYQSEKIALIYDINDSKHAIVIKTLPHLEKLDSIVINHNFKMNNQGFEIASDDSYIAYLIEDNKVLIYELDNRDYYTISIDDYLVVHGYHHFTLTDDPNIITISGTYESMEISLDDFTIKRIISGKAILFSLKHLHICGTVNNLGTEYIPEYYVDTDSKYYSVFRKGHIDELSYDYKEYMYYYGELSTLIIGKKMNYFYEFKFKTLDGEYITDGLNGRVVLPRGKFGSKNNRVATGYAVELLYSGKINVYKIYEISKINKYF